MGLNAYLAVQLCGAGSAHRLELAVEKAGALESAEQNDDPHQEERTCHSRYGTAPVSITHTLGLANDVHSQNGHGPHPGLCYPVQRRALMQPHVGKARENANDIRG